MSTWAADRSRYLVSRWPGCGPGARGRCCRRTARPPACWRAAVPRHGTARPPRPPPRQAGLDRGEQFLRELVTDIVTVSEDELLTAVRLQFVLAHRDDVGHQLAEVRERQ